MQEITYQVRTPDGRVWGPLTDAQVRASISSGGINPNSLITLTGTEAWAPVWQHPVYGPAVRSVPRTAPTGSRQGMSAGKVVAIVLGCVLLLAALIAIPAVFVVNSGKSMVRAVLQESEKPQTLTDPNRTAQLSFPAGWKAETELNDEAGIQASGQFSSLFAIVITEAKADLEGQRMTLQEYSDLVRPDLVKAMTGPRVQGPRRLTVGGHPALQYELSGVSEGEDLAMLHTCVETPARFHQVLLWAQKEHFPGNRKELEGILQSFREPQ